MSLGFELETRRGFTFRKGRPSKRSYQQGVGPLASCFSLLRPGLAWALPPTELKFAQGGMWPHNSSRVLSCVSAVSRNIAGWLENHQTLCCGFELSLIFTFGDSPGSPRCDTTSSPPHLTLAGLKPAIFGSEDQRLIH